MTTKIPAPRIPLSPLTAIENFLDVWGDPHLLYDIAGQLTCREFEALADLMLSLGADPGTVAEFEEAHASQDECGDMHCQCEHEECIKEREV
ncbi:hypothetical protein SEA_SHAM4_76 [Mycobacterium phage Sham4]|uniref:hypothetical protein n=1 Tax=Mycobacterium phage Mulciber TaxID=1805459 RepID=UPI00078B26CB|nr:hypothetical protein BJD74_gp30 [Mycobacterium phage Mulciber]AQT28251.1 hypothetical protein SEA_JABITH_79 [Mycobacterium phage Jabith]ASR86717.1 hypothetical protein SEA_ET2BRUTUS_79 [Mycobacterium phage Et2Brutus]AXC33438.1 hypothetical protein SEA_EBONY_80 [Mycobacterium phage Ebony]AXH50759.1 hypothetical protein SEA_SNAPE_80 [Mycobacterium phage Snape]QBI99102.1 hypothetical protein SEA_SALZ_75 [Mycobacterium phage Salz]QBP32552.1 hypothetical protein SEA_FIBONACCI_79 [Mycobacterium 